MYKETDLNDIFGFQFDIDTMRRSYVVGQPFSLDMVNFYKKWTLRHWLFDHWDWFYQYTEKRLQKLTKSLLDYYQQTIFRGTIKDKED